MHRMMKQSAAMFVALFASVLVLGVGTSVAVCGWVPLRGYHALAVVAGAAVFSYAYAAAVFRVFFRVFPMPQGDVRIGTRDQFVSDVYVLFQLFFFHPLLRNPAVPVPLMRLILALLGARMGHNSFSAGIVQDPLLTEMGDNSLVGESAVVLAHAVEGDRLRYGRVRIGSGVTIGARAIVMPGAIIGDGAIVAANAVVPKGAAIGPREVWGGVPAKKIKVRAASDPFPLLRGS